MTAPDATRRQLLLVAEVTLVLVTVSAVLGLGRLFDDGSFLPEVVLTTVAAHLLAAACRRRQLSTGTSGLVAIAGMILVITWSQLGETTTWGLPTGTTFDQAGIELREAWQTFGDVTAPAPVLPGFVLAASVGAWAIAFAADSAAFRVRALLESIVPASTLFVFGGALGVGPHRLGLSALFLGAVLAHWLAQRALVQTSAPSWLSSERGGGIGSLLSAGAVLVAVAVLGAVTIGPNLPGADARAVVPWRASDRDDPGSRVTISPLVDIRTRLVDQADVEVFRVTSDERSYWRLTSLERFDGRIWSSNRQYRPARGTLDANVDTSGADTRQARSTFTIGALSSIWLPAAFRPVSVSGVQARYDGDSNSLLTESDTATGLRYTVLSELPDLTASDLAPVPPVAPQSLATEYTALPPDFSPAVQQLAGRLVQGAPSQYAKAKALQDFFRSGEFTYDLDVQAGHSDDHLENFLFQVRRGYCEQFSGAFAAMARAVGLPARVAVGFTPGELDPATGEFVVRGFNGHAWPEVYLDGFGWVAFEPTPGRGMPGAEGYTGVPEQQAEAGNPGSATTVPTTTPTTTPAGSVPTPEPSEPDVGLPPVATDDASWPRWVLLAVAVVVLGPVLWAAALAAARVLRRRRRRQAATTPDERVLLAWNEVTEALARTGLRPEPWETPDEFAARASRSAAIDDRLLGGLAGLTATASFSPYGVPETVADQAVEMAGTLEAAADGLVGRRERVRYLLDPRPLLPDRASRVEVREL